MPDQSERWRPEDCSLTRDGADVLIRHSPTGLQEKVSQAAIDARLYKALGDSGRAESPLYTLEDAIAVEMAWEQHVRKNDGPSK